MKERILHIFFKKELDAIRKHFYTEVMKGATDDVLATFNEDVDTRAKELMEQRLSAMLSPVDYSKVVYYDKARGIIQINGESIDPGRLANLNSEASMIAEMDIWQLICETPKELAQRAMFIEGDSIDTMKKGRSMLYHLSAQKNIVDMFKRYKR